MSFTPGGKPPQQENLEGILRSLHTRTTALEKALPQTYSANPPVVSWTIAHGRGRAVGAQAFDASGNLLTPTVLTVKNLDANTVLLTSASTAIATAIVF